VKAAWGRRLAHDILLNVHRGESLDRELAQARKSAANAQEAGQIEELVKGALQWQNRYDFLIRHFSTKHPTEDPRVRGVMHLALHQLLASSGVPSYAAVHQAGELCRAVGRPRAVGYVNAVLQSVVRHVDSAEAASPLDAVHELFLDPTGEVVDYLTDWWSYPNWMVQRWLERYGEAETEQLLRHANQPPPVTLHVLPGHDRDQAQQTLADHDIIAAPVPDFERALRLETRLDRAALREVLVNMPQLLVQDAGAQQVVDWLTREGADLAKAEFPVADICAAPGGKAAHLRVLLTPDQPLLTMDLRPRRLRRTRKNRDRMELSGMPLLAGDGLNPPIRRASLAAVMLDGPCSGTGVGRHHPEGRWRLEYGTIADNGERLLGLARSAAELLVPGGRLYYATCSLEPEENEQVMTALLEGESLLEPDPDADGSWHRAWLPWRLATDGFFAARLRRRPGKD